MPSGHESVNRSVTAMDLRNVVFGLTLLAPAVHAYTFPNEWDFSSVWYYHAPGQNIGKSMYEMVQDHIYPEDDTFVPGHGNCDAVHRWVEDEITLYAARCVGANL